MLVTCNVARAYRIVDVDTIIDGEAVRGGIAVRLPGGEV